MKRLFSLLLGMCIVLLSVGSVGAQEDRCVPKGGEWDAANQRCVLLSNIQMSVNYPLIVSDYPFAETLIDTFITEYQAQFAALFSPVMLETASANQWSLQVDYEQAQAAPHLLSLLLKIGSYTGGAHPNYEFKSFSFDLAAQKVLTLDDLFLPGADVWPVIAQMVQDSLTTQLADGADPQWILDGSGENPDNYQNFVLTPDALIFYFMPYQVAPYAAGAQQVSIPYTALTGLFNEALLTPPAS